MIIVTRPEMAAQATPDPFDRATELEMAERDSVIAFAASRFEADRSRRLAEEASLACLNCEATIPTGQRFCDGDCRDDFQIRARCKSRNGTTSHQDSSDA